MAEQEYIGAVPAARMLGVVPETLVRWYQAGKLDGVIRVRTLPSGHRRYSTTDIENYLKENQR